MDAGTAKFQQPAAGTDIVEHRLQVVFRGRVETAMHFGDTAPQQAIGADGLLPFRTLSVRGNPLSDAARTGEVAELRKTVGSLTLDN